MPKALDKFDDEELYEELFDIEEDFDYDDIAEVVGRFGERDVRNLEENQ